MHWTACETIPNVHIRSLYQKHGSLTKRRSHATIDLGTGSKRIALVTSKQPLGGIRLWFKCPCERRVAVLYQLKGRIGCITCLNLRYGSLIERATRDRLARKLAKLRARAGDRKPRSMPWSKYQRLLERLAEAERLFAASLLPGNSRASQRKLSGKAVSAYINDA